MAYKISKDDLTFIPEVEGAIRRRGHRFAVMLSILSFIFLVTALIWADNAILDEVTQGIGQVIPSSRIQVIQNLEGGIINEVLVSENQIVEKGTILVRIDNVAAETDFRDNRSQYLAALASVTRLEAELADKTPKFPAEIKKEAPRLIRDQMNIFRAHKRRNEAQISVLKSQARQKNQEIAEMKSRQFQLGESLKIAREQRDLTKPMALRGIVPKVDYLRLQRDVVEIQGDIAAMRHGIPRARSALQEARQRITAYSVEWRADATTELHEQYVKLEHLKEVIVEGKDRVRRTEVRSPVRGTVKQIYQNTVGGVIKPGENIMEIVPLDDTLLIEANVRPADIAFLRPGQTAIVKITAYDFSIYGGLSAKVEQISADTIKNEEGESFYRIRLRTDRNSLIHHGKELPIIPGMVATADILTGKKSVLDYILKPILKARQRALRER